MIQKWIAFFITNLKALSLKTLIRISLRLFKDVLDFFVAYL
jgi:hypothetical protein